MSRQPAILAVTAGALITAVAAAALFLPSPFSTGGASDKGDPPAPTTSEAARSGQPPKSQDDLNSDIARDIPGFAGMFFEPWPDPETPPPVGFVPVLNVLLTDPESIDLEELERSIRRHTSGWGRSPYASFELRVHEAKFNAIELQSWHNRADPVIFRLPGVTLSGVNELINRIQYGVAPEYMDETPALIEQALAELGMPPGMVEIVEMDYVRPLICTPEDDC